MPPGEKPTPEMIALTVPDDGRVPAREYKFELDPFQKAAVACIERDESVLVSAHTSAGKTVCAEYAIATSLRAAQRVLYTSPIKALSNQKYRELKEAFGDVGLMTGDVTIDVDASCLVMTTEILRSMLYRGSEVMREVKWVVFDEVHYMRDKERGVVWEEVMILLPHSVRYVMLSATVPNALEFAAWIAQLHSQPCHVVYTGYRPTPLMHYIFPQGGEGLYLTPSDCYKLVQLLVSRGLEPVIIFAFGKAKCEALAGQMMIGKLELNSAEETSMVETIFQNAIDTLTEEDQGLPQVLNLLPMLRRGIAVHHSGLLPVLKELVEILFAENLVKILCATETFAMGLNMPARTVLFAELSKYDGSETRYLTSGEYIQMSGRAGRRGLDARGIVVQMIDERTDAAKVREMLTGRADTLSSRFHLSYNMLLNCVRVETADVERLIQQSFYTFQQQAALPQLQARHKQLMARLAADEALQEALAVEGGLARPPSAEDTLPAEAHILTVPLAHIDRFSSARIKLPADLRPRDARHSVAKVLGEIESRFPDGLPCLAPVEDMKALEEDIPKLLRKIETVQARLAEPRLADPALHAQLPRLRARLAVAADERACRKHMREVEAVLMREELKGMRRVLRKLGHISEDGVIQNKGRVACEVSTADELLTTELVFSGMLNDLEPGALAALLSVLVAEAVEEAKLSIDVAAYVDNLSVSLIDVVVHWCRGAKFADVMEMAGQGMYEGSIIRTLHRLEELLRQLIDAAKVVGNEELEARCAAARKLLVRDVVFAASLYT
ncbi:putative mtr4-involved in nucleocytoplasmic transport of mRNA [Chrysochromulina tobinii]|uniref:Putative mtr4-involved in nucleocytoplasmic transport of mRNA n=1 Tax=Chrysochromulina tobinii TaxID=1460289 RepID=A0A0M0JS91_9EUKA|nr:putative mtr4-involved in nucleocytoplasmic transport of mRNA [Chrysochromulina tobinii]|eukprot:KOO29466.1 putative mtr4-involved in nucleocytoplasmic transport of mRNA [Chrysochromulina sp. CCMP291]